MSWHFENGFDLVAPLKGPRGPVGSSDRALRTTALEFDVCVMNSTQCCGSRRKGVPQSAWKSEKDPQ